MHFLKNQNNWGEREETAHEEEQDSQLAHIHLYTHNHLCQVNVALLHVINLWMLTWIADYDTCKFKPYSFCISLISYLSSV